MAIPFYLKGTELLWSLQILTATTMTHLFGSSHLFNIKWKVKSTLKVPERLDFSILPPEVLNKKRADL